MRVLTKASKTKEVVKADRVFIVSLNDVMEVVKLSVNMHYCNI